MKKLVTLINPIDYDYKYLEYATKGNTHYLDGNNFRTKCLSLERITYTSEDIVHINSDLETVANEITESFKQTFINRGREATEEQIYFANETAKVVLGESVDNKLIIDPAPCGFGKSTIKLELMRYFCSLYSKGLTTEGVIIAGDRLEDLRQLQEDLGEDSKYTYLIEGWNEDICLDKTKKTVETGMCWKCDFWECKIKKQITEQVKYPIILVSNARLKEFGGDFYKMYKDYDNGQRRILLIDEKPQMFDNVEVSIELLDKINTAISHCKYEDKNEKTQLLKYWNDIKEMIENKMSSLRENYKRFIISNNCNIPVCMDNEPFMKLWNKHMKNNFKKELDNIHEVLTKGGFYVGESDVEFISTIRYNNLREYYSAFDKVVIFDGSSLYDPEYLGLYDYDKKEDIDNSDLRFLYIPNSRTYENLHITAYTGHKLTKTEFNNKPYLPYAIANFIKDKLRIGVHRKSYIVTYRQQATKLGQLLAKDTLKIQIPKMEDGRCFYYGNTKGSNNMSDCTQMFNIGWDTLPDYQIAIKYLSCNITAWNKLLEVCQNTEKAIKYSEVFIKDNRNELRIGSKKYSSGTQYCFGWEDIDEFQYLDMVSKFYQEIHRTKLRDYNYEGEIKVYLFQTKQLIYSMLEALLPNCHLKRNADKLQTFQKGKDDNRKNKCKGYDEFFEWYDSWDGSLIKSKDLKEALKLNNEQFKTLTNNQTVNETFSKFDKPKRGFYSYESKAIEG